MFKKLTLILLFIFILACNSITFAHPPIEIFDLYDNTVYQPGLKADWGFSCLIAGMLPIKIFQKEYPTNLITLGVGKSITLED